MPTIVLKLSAGQGSQTDGQPEGQSGNYMLPPLGSIKITPFMSILDIQASSECDKKVNCHQCL